MSVSGSPESSSAAQRLEELRGEGPPSEHDELAVRARTGDRKAMEQLISEFEAAVYRVAYRILGHHELAEDARQETFIRMLHSMPNYDHTRRFSTWLFTIATHVALDIARSNRPSLPTPPAAEPSADDPQQAFIQKEEMSRIEEAMVLLSPQMRTLLALRFQENLTPTQISRVLSVTPNQVRVDLFRARMELRRVLRVKSAARS
jgi:RNA polymerase sigma-70 factor, ECF subfamily